MNTKINIVGKLKKTGVVDGLWTISSSIGSKLQTLVLLSITGRQFGIEGVGLVILSMSAAILVSSIADMGLASQVIRSFSAGELRNKKTILIPLFGRILVVILGATIVTFLFVAPHGEPNNLGGWIISSVAYGAGFHASLLVSQTAYGHLRYKQGAALTGIVRLSTIPILFLSMQSGWPVYVLVLVLGLGEASIALIQYRLIPRHNDGHVNDNRDLLKIRRTWRYGVGSIANTVMNKSDTVIITFVAGAAVIGTYGLASQVENALTTVALIPAGAIVAYTARSKTHRERKNVGYSVSIAVACTYAIVAIPFAIFPAELIYLVFGTHVNNSWPFIICIIAGLFSCLGGVAMQQLVGMGEQRIVMMTWILVATLAITALMIGAYFFGAIGAAAGALFRDLVFFTLTFTSLRRKLKARTEIEESI